MSREAMQMALEALEDANDVARMEFSDEDYYSEAINALRQALEEKQEPVAWITNGGKGELWWHQSSKFDEEGNLIGPNPDDIPLYTAPPKREWVGLHGSEVPDPYKYDVMFNEGWWWAEEKLKEKNHG